MSTKTPIRQFVLANGAAQILLDPSTSTRDVLLAVVVAPATVGVQLDGLTLSSRQPGNAQAGAVIWANAEVRFLLTPRTELWAFNGTGVEVRVAVFASAVEMKTRGKTIFKTASVGTSAAVELLSSNHEDCDVLVSRLPETPPATRSDAIATSSIGSANQGALWSFTNGPIVTRSARFLWGAKTPLWFFTDGNNVRVSTIITELV